MSEQQTKTTDERDIRVRTQASGLVRDHGGDYEAARQSARRTAAHHAVYGTQQAAEFWRDVDRHIAAAAERLLDAVLAATPGSAPPADEEDAERWDGLA